MCVLHGTLLVESCHCPVLSVSFYDVARGILSCCTWYSFGVIHNTSLHRCLRFCQNIFSQNEVGGGEGGGKGEQGLLRV